MLTEDWIGSAEDYRRHWATRGLPGSFAEFSDGSPRYAGSELARFRKAQRAMERFVQEFHRRGGKVTAGTMSPVRGYGVQDELALLVRSGLSPAAALRAATADAADVLGRGGEIGRTRPGARADLGSGPIKGIPRMAVI